MLSSVCLVVVPLVALMKDQGRVFTRPIKLAEHSSCVFVYRPTLAS